MCRKQFGHVFAATGVPRAAVTIRDEECVTWYRSSEKARRGFCAICGSFLFWDAIHKDRIALATGAFDTPTGTKLSKHIFVADKGDYYDIADGLPQNSQ